MFYEIKSPMGENLNFSLDEIVFQLLSIYDFECDNSEVLDVIQYNKVIFLFSFTELKKEILKYRFKSGIVTTKDNIAEYYEFMSDEDLEDCILLDEIFHKRIILLEQKLNLKKGTRFLHLVQTERKHYIVSYCIDIRITKRLICFGVKDTLKSIDEYISEIKNSVGYKNHILLSIIKDINDERVKNKDCFISDDDANSCILDILKCYFIEDFRNGINIDSFEFLELKFSSGAELIRDAKEKLLKITKDGWEGLFLKKSTHMQIAGKKSKDAIKLKHKFTADLTCTGWDGIYLLLKDESGLTAKVAASSMRDYIAIGMVVEIEYEQIIKTYNQAVFKCIRYDKSY